MYQIYVISDGTGETASQILKAALCQFETAKVNITLRPHVRTQEKISEVIEEVSRGGGLIVYTLVSNELRHFMEKKCRLYNNIENIDLLGPLLIRLSEQLTFSPSEKPGLFHQINEEYFRRLETIEFAFHHDDGQRYSELSRAEIVLIGVSRTFKTPLSIYLAFKGWFVGNVPIVYKMEPPSVLFDLPAERVFCLTTNHESLAKLRKVRQEHFKGALGNYAEPDFVRQELDYALDFFNKQPMWPIIDVTNKSIEEIAVEILKGERRSQTLIMDSAARGLDIYKKWKT
ncbi:MAG: pyruvate, water dikinase regulatory protein [bacterium]